MPSTSLLDASARRRFLLALDAALSPARFAEVASAILDTLVTAEELRAISPALPPGPVGALVVAQRPFAPCAMAAVMDADGLVALARHLVHGDDELSFSLCCKAFRAAASSARGLGADKQMRQTTRRSMLQSPARFDWAIESFPKIFGAWGRGDVSGNDIYRIASRGDHAMLEHLVVERGVDISSLSIPVSPRHFSSRFPRTIGAACAGAASGGHLEVLQWLRGRGVSAAWDTGTCSIVAAEGGHLEVLQWACANGCPCGEDTCSGAAYGGHLEVLQWARANGCPWDEYTCSDAAEGGHLEVLQWARANGCPEFETSDDE